ncbi:MAG: hypothetical protein R3F11_27695 [Verrucomicrobiales bacterium]
MPTAPPGQARSSPTATTVHYTYSLAADDALVTAEFATDAIGWQSDPGDESVSAFISAVNHGDGTLSVTLMPALQRRAVFRAAAHRRR